MRICAAWWLVCAGAALAQAPYDPDVVRAQAGIERLRALVEAGAAPRADLERAQEVLADAQDAALLRRTLYGADLMTDQQAEDMVAATGRRLARRQKALEKAEELVKDGVVSQLSLGTYLDELDRARKENDLAISRARLAHELTEMAKAEEELQKHLEEAPQQATQVAERYDGSGVFTRADLLRVETAFESRFAKPLPVSAMGETAVHRALGFDHRDRVDVAVHPDQPEGVWLRQYLADQRIPYFAFRQAVPGKATGAHIHIGPMSARLAHGG
ncbi:MAG TPA: hypothetical protein VFA33_04660 [Bryobacteraceae bacterium]|nr:hypothetical protein [Bryobacteraceae bacterium]